MQRGPFQSAYVGYWIDAPHAGRGYVPEGVAVSCATGSRSLHLHRIEAAIVPRNAAQSPGRATSSAFATKG